MQLQLVDEVSDWLDDGISLVKSNRCVRLRTGILTKEQIVFHLLGSWSVGPKVGVDAE